MTPLLRTILFFFIASLLSQATSAARYDIALINEPQVNAINNIGTIVGINSDGLPYVWHRNQKDNSYPEETETPEADRLFKKLLPISFTYSEIHVLDINNELSVGSGGSIVGWYVDENGLRQSILWYLEENKRNEYSYSVLTLPPHQLFARYCSGEDSTDFNQPECLLKDDSELIFRASQCTIENANWVTPSQIFVDKMYKFNTTSVEDPNDSEKMIDIPPESPDCSNSIPICKFKIEKIPDGEKTIQGEDGFRNVPAFKYKKDVDYENGDCILFEHAQFSLLVSQCDNNSFNESGEPLVIKCDISSIATGINNENLIMGISYKPDGNNRPIFWAKGEGKAENEKPKYLTGDLGTQRNTSALDASIKGTDPDNGVLNEATETLYRNGYPTAIDKTRNAIVGMIRESADPDAKLIPTYWTNVQSGSFDIPETLRAPQTNTEINDACKISTPASIEFKNTVTPTGLGNGLAIAWYEDDNQNARPVMWTPCPIKNKDNEVIEQLTPGHIPTLDENDTRNIGKALSINAVGEVVGSTFLDVPGVVDENGVQLSEDHAFFRSGNCGIQDLNGLLETPITNRSLIFESANYIASGVPPTAIIAQGKSTESGDVNSYILTPRDVFVDLEVSVKSDNDRLTVGDQHTITVTVVNKGAVDNESTSNYATCIFFRLAATVYTQDLYEDKIKEARKNGITVTDEMDIEFARLGKIKDELAGGLTFDENYLSNKIDDVYCFVTLIDIVCAIERIDPGVLNAITVSVTTTPRPLLADRTVRTAVSVYATEKETSETALNNTSFELINVDREACFIATAAYGSYLNPQVKILRDFRDQVLLQSIVGTHLVNFYYDVSPPLAKFISKSEPLRVLTRWILSPMIYAIAFPAASLFLLFILMLTLRLMIKKRRLA